MLDGFTNEGLYDGCRPLLSMGKLGWVNWEIIPVVVLYLGSIYSRLPVIPFYLGLNHQISESVIPLKSRVILEGRGIPLLSFNSWGDINRCFNSGTQYSSTIMVCGFPLSPIITYLTVPVPQTVIPEAMPPRITEVWSSFRVTKYSLNGVNMFEAQVSK